MKSNIYHSNHNELKLIAGDTSTFNERIPTLTPEIVRQYIESWAFINTNWTPNSVGGLYIYVDIKIDGTWINSRSGYSVDIPEYDNTKQCVQLKRKNFSVWCRPQNGWTINKKFGRHNLKPVDGINAWGRSHITITKK